MTGRQIKSLMIVNNMTIRSLSIVMQITQVRIREIRKSGLTCRYTVRDWIEAITGSDPGAQ